MKIIKEELKKRLEEYNNFSEYKVPLDKYSELLKQEVNKKNNKTIDTFIKNKQYDKAVNFVEENTNNKLELPLKNILEFSSSNINSPNIIKENSLLLNNKITNNNFLKALKTELDTSNEVLLTVSFIRFSGVQLLINKLKELEEKNIKVKILTSLYLNITQPKALKKLLSFKNIELKIYNSGNNSFHSKGYIFKRDNNLSTAIIGSSNISHQALLCGEEWNVKIHQDNGNILDDAIIQFNKLWNSENTVSVDENLINDYVIFLDKEINKENNYNSNIKQDFFKSLNAPINSPKLLKPNSMQSQILENLKQTRLEGFTKGLVISATGTGKTYLSLFDVVEVNPKRVLFIAHREELLRGALNSYSKIFNKDDLGLLTGNEKNIDKKIIFATIQSLSKDKTLNLFNKNDFDYIVVDEFHHSIASSYQKIMNYFKPKFLLGLTATPERMDGQDILKLCDYNIVGEIRLKEALERELLVPFHYFGISDTTVDYDNIKIKNNRYIEKDLSKSLSINTRSEFVKTRIEKYQFDGNKMCGLGFCVDKNHAKFMNLEFQRLGYKSDIIISDTPKEARNIILKKLKNKELEVVFTVDIFNEGVDIPPINLLLFLRPTESQTIFIQQLGRGLRKYNDKKFLTVLDFIGNYKKAFTGSLALTRELGEPSDKLRENIQEGFNLPSTSHIEFEKICQKKILDKLENIKYTSKNYLKELYIEVMKKYKRPLIPMDFLYEEDSFEKIINNFGSFHKVKSIMNDYDSPTDFPIYVEELLARIDNMIPLKRPHELLILKYLLLDNNTKINKKEALKHISSELKLNISNLDINLQKQRIDRAFRELSETYKKQNLILGEFKDNIFFKNPILYNISDDIILEIKNRIDYGLLRFKREMKNKDGSLEIYKKYSRLDLQILLDSTVPKGSWRAGYAVAHREICLFITMEKDSSTKEDLLYDNYFDNQNIVQWISQNKTAHTSKVGKMFIDHKILDFNIHIFIRKSRENNGFTRDFTYLGKADYHSHKGDKPMYIKWRLHNKVLDSIFIDLTN